MSRQGLIDSRFSTVVCAGVYSAYDGIATQVLVDEAFGLKRMSSVHCDDLMGIHKRLLTNFIGTLSEAKMAEVSRAMAVALGIQPEDIADL